MRGKEGSCSREGPPPRMPKGRKKGTGRGGSLTCQGSAPVKEIDRWTDKGTKGQTQGRRKMARGQSSQGQGCTKCLGHSWPDTTPQSRPPVGGPAWFRAPRRAVAGPEPHPQGGPVSTAPSPAARGRCRTDLPHGSSRAGAQRRLSSSAGSGLGALDRWRGRVRLVGRTDVPILLQGAVSGQGCPKGPGRLVEGGAGCKGVPRGIRGRGQGLGRDRAGQGRRGAGGIHGRWAGGTLSRRGMSLWRVVERTAVLQPHPHTSGQSLGEVLGGVQVSRGPFGRNDLSLHRPKGRQVRLVAQASRRQRTDRQSCMVPRPCGSPGTNSQFPRFSQLWPLPSTLGQEWKYQGSLLPRRAG